MTEQAQITGQPDASVVYKLIEFGGYWRSAKFHSRNALILGAIARGFTYVGKSPEGWPIFGPGIATTWERKPDTLYGPRWQAEPSGEMFVTYRDTAAAYLVRWPVADPQFHASDM
jgi:hypothetical protein